MTSSETLQEKVERVTKEPVRMAPYNPDWPDVFEAERQHLLTCLPDELINRIEHFGSTSVPELTAKPIVDMLVEVTSLEETKRRIVPILEGQDYEYFWRPSWGDDIPPFYAWFIKRDEEGWRTHHIHMVEHDFPQWDELLFRDYLRDHPDVAEQYAELKQQLARKHQRDRVAYTEGKTDFVTAVTEKARKYYSNR